MSEAEHPAKKAKVVAPAASNEAVCNAIVVPTSGGAAALTFQTIPAPSAAPDGLVVDIDAAGVNYIDTYQRTGLYPLPEPKVLGREGAGTVSAVGPEAEKAGWKVGDRVAFLAQGSYSQRIAIPAKSAVRVPDDLSLAHACAALLQGLTAHYLATGSYAVQKGDTVLVHAGAGGTGALLVQMAKLKGAIVIATVGSEEKAKVAKAAGADHTILYREVDFQAEVQRITEGKGCAAVYDGVGKTTWEGSLKSCAKRGTLVLFGNASGAVPPLNPLALKDSSLYLTRPKLGDFISDPEEKAMRCNELFGWLAKGQVRLRVAAEFPLEHAQKAHELLESRNAIGKILLRCNK